MRVVIGLFLLSACFSMQPETLSIAYAAEHPGPYLTGVDTVAYHGILEPGIGNCKVDWEAWNTSIDFVANQSTKLKLLTDIEHHKRADKLADKNKAFEATKPPLSKWNDDDRNEWQSNADAFSKYLFAPRLSFDIITIETGAACAAVIISDVTMAVKPAKTIATDILVSVPNISVWSETRSLSGPLRGFSKFVVQTSEEMLKGFINDWAASQREPF